MADKNLCIDVWYSRQFKRSSVDVLTVKSGLALMRKLHQDKKNFDIVMYVRGDHGEDNKQYYFVGNKIKLIKDNF